MSQRFIAFAATVLITLLGTRLSGQGPASPAVKKVPAPFTRASSGREMYLAYCASCHGKDGKGNGPAAPALKSIPTDLTQLAARNGGRFPENHVAQTIKGDFTTPSHGSKEMPIWGALFASMGTASDGSMQLRIRNLARYIASLQQ